MKKRVSMITIALVLLAATASAVDTRLTVRVFSRDAKVVGTKVGGAKITIRDSRSGRVLAEGEHVGSTGNTKKIMVAPHERSALIYGADDSASFVANLDLDEPTWVDVLAEGALGYPQSSARASKTLLLFPGEHVEGEGLLLELHGFNIELLAPTERVVKSGTVPVRITLTMVCGCPIEPGGMWNADDINVRVQLFREGKRISETPMKFDGEVSHFGAELAALAPGNYTLRILASNPKIVNFAMYEHELEVE